MTTRCVIHERARPAACSRSSDSPASASPRHRTRTRPPHRSCPTSSSPRRAPSSPRSTCPRRSTRSRSAMRPTRSPSILRNSSKAFPGVLARDRQNYAQDEQISIRGFGARATFGVRGVRLYTDGIPATMPDGQGQVSHFNLDSADRVEVLRGPFSALYGNSSGGVIQLFTADGSDPGQIKTGLVGQSYDTWRASINARGVYGPDRLQPRLHAFPDRRLSRSQRGAARIRQWKAQHQGRRRRQADAAFEHRQPAERAGPARSDARAVRERSAAGVAGRVALQHAQERAAVAGRRDLRAAVRRRQHAAHDGLLRPARRDAVPRDSGRDAGQPAAFGRRRRSRRQVRRHGHSLDVEGRSCGPPVRDRDRRQLRPPGTRAQGLREFRRRHARRARCTAPQRGRHRVRLRSVRAGDLAVHRHMVVDGRRAPQRSQVRFRRPLHHRCESGRLGQRRLQRDDAGRGPHVARVRYDAPLRLVRQGLRDADVQRARLSRRRRLRARVQSRAGQEQERRARHQVASDAGDRC